MNELLTLEEVKQYLRVDYEDEDQLLQSLITAAMTYLKYAIENFEMKVEKNEYKERTKILALVLVQEWFDNRELRENKEVSYTVRSLMTQLQVSDVV